VETNNFIHHHHGSILDAEHDPLCPDPGVRDGALLCNKTSPAAVWSLQNLSNLAANAFTLGDIITSSNNEFLGFTTRIAKLFLLISSLDGCVLSFSEWPLVLELFDNSRIPVVISES